jgi:hypothetical protein
MKRPELGSWHTINEIASKDRRNSKTTWKSYECEPCKAMYIGWRTKFNGIIVYDGDPEYGYVSDTAYFEQLEPVRVWLFIVEERQNPICVFPFEFESKGE